MNLFAIWTLDHEGNRFSLQRTSVLGFLQLTMTFPSLSGLSLWTRGDNAVFIISWNFTSLQRNTGRDFVLHDCVLSVEELFRCCLLLCYLQGGSKDLLMESEDGIQLHTNPGLKAGPSGKLHFSRWTSFPCTPLNLSQRVPRRDSCLLGCCSGCSCGWCLILFLFLSHLLVPSCEL